MLVISSERGRAAAEERGERADAGAGTVAAAGVGAGVESSARETAVAVAGGLEVLHPGVDEGGVRAGCCMVVHHGSCERGAGLWGGVPRGAWGVGICRGWVVLVLVLVLVLVVVLHGGGGNQPRGAQVGDV